MPDRRSTNTCRRLGRDSKKVVPTKGWRCRKWAQLEQSICLNQRGWHPRVRYPDPLGCDLSSVTYGTACRPFCYHKETLVAVLLAAPGISKVYFSLTSASNADNSTCDPHGCYAFAVYSKGRGTQILASFAGCKSQFVLACDSNRHSAGDNLVM